MIKIGDRLKVRYRPRREVEQRHLGSETGVKHLVVALCTVALLTACAPPLNATSSARMAELMTLCEDSGGKHDFDEINGTVECTWKLDAE